MTNTEQPLASSEMSTPTNAKVYEIREFVTLKPGEGYIKVRHSRTIFDEKGRVRQELLPMEDSVEHLIRAFNGRVEQAGGIINGLFSDDETARECARRIELHFGKRVEIASSSLTIQA